MSNNESGSEENMGNDESGSEEYDYHTLVSQKLDQALDAEEDGKKDFHIRQAFQAIQGIAEKQNTDTSDKQASD